MGGTGQPDFLIPIFRFCSSWRGQLANRLEELGSKLGHQIESWR